MVGVAALLQREERHQNIKREERKNQAKEKRKRWKEKGGRKIHSSSPIIAARSSKKPHKRGRNFYYREKE